MQLRFARRGAWQLYAEKYKWIMDYSLYDDSQLIDGMLSNDSNVIAYFINKKCRPIFLYIIANIFESNIDINELISELYLYLAKDDWQIIRRFAYRSSLMTYISVVAVRYFKKKRERLIEKQSHITLNEKTMMIDHPTASLISERMIDVQAALRRMPNERYRKVIEVLDLQDESPEKLAEEMNVTIDNMYNIHRRALIQLRLIMGRKEDYV